MAPFASLINQNILVVPITTHCQNIQASDDSLILTMGMAVDLHKYYSQT